LRLREQECEIAVNLVLGLKDVGGLNTFPGGGDLDQNASLVNALFLVELRNIRTAPMLVT